MLMANGALQVAFGPATSMVILHATGTAVLIILLLAKRASFVRSEAVPAYLFLSGALGVLLVFLNNTTVAAIGLTPVSYTHLDVYKRQAEPFAAMRCHEDQVAITGAGGFDNRFIR